MYIARLMIVFLLIIVALMAYDPVTREEGKEAWMEFRPVVVAFMDGMYAAVRDLIAGDESQDRIDDNPVPPEIDFDRIVTMEKALAFS